MPWSPESIALLRRLWQTEMSASRIGLILGVSKSAVVGKAHRLELESRPSPISRGNDPDDWLLPELIDSSQLQENALTAGERVVHPEPIRKTPYVFPRAKACCWPIGEPSTKGFRFCEGVPVVRRTSYCEQHARLAYVKTRPVELRQHETV